jgi:hypothetical protein
MTNLMGRAGRLLSAVFVMALPTVKRLGVMRGVRDRVATASGEVEAGEQCRVREEREQSKHLRRVAPPADTLHKRAVPAKWPHDLLRARYWPETLLEVTSDRGGR